MGKFITNWEEFFKLTIELLLQDPFRAKLTLKHYKRKNCVIIRVTDGKHFAKYKVRTEEEFSQIDQIVKISSKILSNNQQEEAPSSPTTMDEQKNPEDASNKKKKKKEAGGGKKKAG